LGWNLLNLSIALFLLWRVRAQGGASPGPKRSSFNL
jgi:hypothetical protein